ncbi:hypothetical protein COF64_18790, partial [Bacillus sp. AFS043905]
IPRRCRAPRADCPRKASAWWRSTFIVQVLVKLLTKGFRLKFKNKLKIGTKGARLLREKRV